MKQTQNNNIDKNNKKSMTMVISIALIALVVYNVVIFFTFGLKDHNGIFWFSWGITIIGAFCVVVSLFLLGPIRAFLRDWLFGFPIVRYGAMYCVMQYTASFTFMKMEQTISPKIVYPVQAVLLGAYLILAITCFLTKDNIKQTETVNFEKTIFMKQLRAEIASLANYTENEELKKELSGFSDEAKYSDPVSSEWLTEIENTLAEEVKACREALKANDEEKAFAMCRQAVLTLKERNEKCKTLKRSE